MIPLPADHEVLEIQIDSETTARLHIQVTTEPPIPTPQEVPRKTAPSIRQLDTISQKLLKRQYTLPPL